MMRALALALLAGSASAQPAPDAPAWDRGPVWCEVSADAGQAAAGAPDTAACQFRVPAPASGDAHRAAVLLAGAMPRAVPRSAPLAAPPDTALAAFYASVAALRRADPVLRHGRWARLAASGRAVAFERVLGAQRRVVVLNAGSASAFVPLPGDGVPVPLVAVVVSRADAGPIASLVASFDDDAATYGLHIPAHTTVVFRPAVPADVRPDGLDE